MGVGLHAPLLIWMVVIRSLSIAQFIMVHYGSLWFIMVHYDSVWFIIGSSWLFTMVHYGSLWFIMAHRGCSLWLIMYCQPTPFYTVLHRFTPFTPFCTDLHRFTPFCTDLHRFTPFCAKNPVSTVSNVGDRPAPEPPPPLLVQNHTQHCHAP